VTVGKPEDVAGKERRVGREGRKKGRRGGEKGGIERKVARAQQLLRRPTVASTHTHMVKICRVIRIKMNQLV